MWPKMMHRAVQANVGEGVVWGSLDVGEGVVWGSSDVGEDVAWAVWMWLIVEFVYGTISYLLYV